jgi:tetratricopeptide (TPR) repeat protein
VALSRCTSLQGISLKEPSRRNDIFVRAEVQQFARHYNDNNMISAALSESKADKQYYDAVQAFDRGDMDAFLKHFFLAIHSRYDIEKPAVKRLIRRKLNIINLQANEIARLRDEQKQQRDFLRRLATEYVILGKECEAENMSDAAIANYEKALHLCPEHPEAKRRLKRLKKK